MTSGWRSADGFCRGISRTGYVATTRASDGWHSDITFENVPSDYAVRILFDE